MYYSLQTLSSDPADSWPILMYHQLGRPPKFSRQRGLFVSRELFRRQMDELCQAGFETVSLDAVRAAPEGTARRVTVTFDDGFAGAFHVALPILSARDFSAIQFIVANRKTNQWDADLGHARYPLMDDHQIADWLAAGHEIGAHSLSHPHLTQIPLGDARQEIFESKARLEDRFQRPVRHFCYPYGDVNPAIRELVMEAGFETACSTDAGSHRVGGDPFRLARWMATHRRPVLAAWVPTYH